MTADRPARPLLATLICFYEIAIVLLAIVSQSFFRWFHATHLSAPYRPTPFLQSAASILSYILAICAAILLWRMRHLASYLLATRAVTSLIGYVFALMRITPQAPTQHARVISLTTIHWIFYVMGFTFLILNTSIAWYVYRITSPQNQRLTDTQTFPSNL